MNQSSKYYGYFKALVYLSFTEEHFSSETLTMYAKKIDRTILQDGLHHEHFRFVPLLYKNHLKKFFSVTAWKKIEGTYKHTHYRNRVQLDRADKFQKIFTTYKITPVILLKGLSLLANVYDDLGQRPMGDIDFFIPNYPVDDSALRLEIIHKFGLRVKTDCFRAVTFVDEQKFEIDIHRFIADNAISSHIAELSLKHAIKINAKGYCFTILCPEHQFFSVVYHGITSPGVRYSKRWMVDAILILNRYTLSPQQVIEFANCFDAPSALLIALDELLNLSLKLAAVNDQLEQLFLQAKKGLHTESQLYRYFRILPASPDSGGEKQPVSKSHWLRSVVGFYLISPYVYRRFISIKHYYYSVLKIRQNDQAICRELWRKIKRRFYYVFLGKWI